MLSQKIVILTELIRTPSLKREVSGSFLSTVIPQVFREKSETGYVGRPREERPETTTGSILIILDANSITDISFERFLGLGASVLKAFPDK